MHGNYYYRWSASSSVTVPTEDGFGSGRSNTKEMLEREGSNSNTLWGVINGNTGEERNEGPEWFVPSREEFAAFGAAFNINSSNYRTQFGLSNNYWSSSQDIPGSAYTATFSVGGIYGDSGVSSILPVRLATTF